MDKKYSLLLCALIIVATGQVVQAQVQTLEPSKAVERDIAGGELHNYRLSLMAGQLMRVVAEQKIIDVSLKIAGPDGEQLVEANFGDVGELESLSVEAAGAGEHQLTIRAIGAATMVGSYQVRLEVKAAASTEDRQRMAAERLLAEASSSHQKGAAALEATLEKARQALTLWRSLGDRHREAATVNLIGQAYASAANYEQAIEAFDQALGIRREVKDRPGEGNTLYHLGRAYDELDRYEKAIEYQEQALAIRREVKDRRGEGRSIGNLGVLFWKLGRYEKAIECYEQSLAINREVKDRRGEGTVYNNLGGVYFVLGRNEKALEYYEQGLAIRRELKDRWGEGRSLGNLGIAYAAMGRYEKAIESYEQALAIAREVKHRRDEGYQLSYLGAVYLNLGRHEKVLEYFEQALAIAREVKDRLGEGHALAKLGSASETSGRYEKAIEYYEQSLAIARELKDRLNESKVLNNLGNVDRKLGRYDKATEYYEQALAMNREMKNRIGEGAALSNLGDTNRDMGRHEKAIEYYEQALAIYREVNYRAGEPTALYDLSYSERARGNLAAARTYIEESLKVSEATRAEVISPESRASFLADVQRSYQFYTDLLMRQHRAEPTKRLDVLAFETSEFRRARGLLDLLAEAGADIRQGVDVALVERERSLGQQLGEKAGLLTRAKPEQVETLRKEIGQLELEYERAQTAIRKASPYYAALTQPQPVKLSEVQAQLDADTLLLEYSLGADGKEQSYLWAITRDSLTSYELPKGKDIEKTAREVYELLTVRTNKKFGESEPQRQARIVDAEARLPSVALALSKTVLAPVAAQLGSKRLIIVADGALQYIPFAMLPDPAADNNQPLVVGHEIISLPSASTLVFQRKELAGRQPAPKTLAVIADPVFDRTDVRFKASVSAPDDKAPAGKPADTRGLEHILDESSTPERRVIRRLPFTRQEADALLALTPKDSSFKAIDFQANRANVLNGDLSQYRYVHFATHGVMDAQRPGLSSLVLSTVDAEGKTQNGFLRANDIYNMKLPAELVVLSACQTGLGKEVKGEGLIGLTRGFMYAGAKRVVVSLWSVNDKATSDLMTKFYRGMLKDNERPAAALRAAQIEMWKQKKWQSPYYWAAFTMQGEWK